jgi:hypothetical protein
MPLQTILLRLLSLGLIYASIDVKVYNSTNHLIATNPPSINSGKYVTVGTAGETLKIWYPFEAGKGGSPYIEILVDLAIDYITQTSVNNTQKYNFFIENADWSGVVQDPICNGTLPCPDIIILGTTQLGARIHTGDLLPLDDFFSDYVSEHGVALADTFLKQYYYDLYNSGSWYAVPFLVDTRLIIYNRTLFDTLRLEYPPPFGNWNSSTWTWLDFVRYSKIIKDAGYGYGFNFGGGWDEDLKLVAVMAREYNTQLLTNNKCGYRDPRFIKMLKDIVYPLWVTDKSANPNINVVTNSWINSPLPSELKENPIFCCKGTTPELTMDFAATGLIKSNDVYDYRRNSNATTGVGFVPGRTSFLGGSKMQYQA